MLLRVPAKSRCMTLPKSGRPLIVTDAICGIEEQAVHLVNPGRAVLGRHVDGVWRAKVVPGGDHFKIGTAHDLRIGRECAAFPPTLDHRHLGHGLNARRNTKGSKFREELVDQVARQRLIVADAEIGDRGIALRNARFVEHDDAAAHAVLRVDDAEEAHQPGPRTFLGVFQVDARVLAGPGNLAGMDGTLARHVCFFPDIQVRPRPATRRSVHIPSGDCAPWPAGRRRCGDLLRRRSP